MLIATAFLLFAEERDMLPEDEVFVRYYSIAGLDDSGLSIGMRFPDPFVQAGFDRG